MSEKRFSIHELVHYDEEQDKWVDCDRYCITDNENHINYDLKFDERQLCSLLNEQQATIQSLKERLYDFEKRKIIEESEIDEDVIPKVKLLRTELFGEKYE